MCIEVVADGGTRVLLDLGMPLMTRDGGGYPRDTPRRATADLLADGILREIPGLYPDDPSSPSIEAIVLTHSHLDHYGLVHHAHPAIPVYGSSGTIAILQVGSIFFPDTTLPPDLRTLPTNEPVRIGSLAMTAIPVDHAAPDSRALLVEADGQRLFYTGDFRAHGRTSYRFEGLLKDERLKGVDWLLVEGTTLGSSAETHGLGSEVDVEDCLVELARKRPDALIAIAASGQNIDRLVSCFRAAKRTGRTLVIDPYQAFVLMRLSSLSKSIPQFTWDGIRVSFAPYQVSRLKDAGMMDFVYQMGERSKVTSTELATGPGGYLACVRGGFGTTKILDKIGSDKFALVWSMWRGYWERGECALRAWSEREAVEAQFIHSGGHAWPDDLRRLVDAVGAKQTVWVHTDWGDRVTGL
jgi:ribonuclease J